VIGALQRLPSASVTQKAASVSCGRSGGSARRAAWYPLAKAQPTRSAAKPPAMARAAGPVPGELTDCQTCHQSAMFSIVQARGGASRPALRAGFVTTQLKAR
jgi:mono/diheme cytochrome c family protein